MSDAAPESVWQQIRTILIAVLIALTIRAFIIEPFRIPSGSMFPTLLIGDHLFVNKFIYGPKVPFSDMRLPGLREPERGDIIVFTVARRGNDTFPADRHPEYSREEFVKRIVGLPGDRVEIQGSKVFINGVEMDVEPLSEAFTDPSGRELDVLRVAVDSKQYKILDDPNAYFRAPRPVTTVEEGRYLVLGDNRDHSKDSRVWGTVRKAEIKGPAFMLYWSWDFNDGWLELLNPLTWWKAEKRWDRIGTKLQ
ncbi:MAG: signal peptidase I [Deltaproteobacteria bacterium]|nr:signal peptidase I [Deltaproteobacteria bacterium]MBW2668219.1 signal peptidase I [Deltaproteobacteria bacterium]